MSSIEELAPIGGFGAWTKGDRKKRSREGRKREREIGDGTEHAC